MKNVKQKVKKGIIGLAAFAALTVAGTAGAVVDCPVATITKVGILPDKETTTTSKYMVRATCSDTTKWPDDRSFMLSSDIGDSGYATLLTAMSLNQPIFLRVEGPAPAAWWGLSTLLYLNAQ
jgi:hypothetical protein